MRVAGRHGLVAAECGYHELQDFFQSALPEDLDLYGDFHAQLVEVGKRFCRPRPRCAECPLHPVLGEPEMEDFGP
jgi:endonuclease-3 related protein